MRHSIPSLLLVFAFGSQALAAPTPPPAAPAPTPADAQALEDAKRHFVQGVALFNDGNFSAALAEFESAYRVRQSPGVLYNIGLTQKALFRYTEAIATLEKYLGADAKLAPERRNEVKQLVGEMRSLLAEVTLDVTPKGASILVDGRTVATAPLAEPMGIAAGNHVIEVTLEGYKPARKEVIVTAGVAMKLKLHLDAVPRSGFVRIMTKQSGATVMIDGKTLGPAPVEAELPLGGHQLEVWANGFKNSKSEIIIAAGQKRDVMIELDKKIYKKAALWAPLAVLTAVGVVCAILVPPTFDKATLDGTLAPGAARVTP